MRRLIYLLTLSLAAPAALPAQPHHHHGGTTGYGFTVQPQHHDHVLVDPHGHVVRQHHDAYQYVIPAARPTQGTYYTHQNTQYYTPPLGVVQGQTSYGTPTAIAYGGFNQFEDLSSRIETLANETCLDLHYNYQHNPQYPEVYREAYSLLQQAKALHAAEHNQDRNYIRTTVQGVDGLLHHLQDEARQLAPHVVRPIGAYSLPDKLAQLESIIHHLMHDVGIPPHAEGTGAATPPGGGVEQAPPPPGFPQSQVLPGGQFGSQYSTTGGLPNTGSNPPGVFLNTAPPDTIFAPRP